MKIVLVDGCFDLLHPGHIKHLKEARALGGFLIVSLTRDRNVAVNKPGRPIYKWKDRALLLRSFPFVDKVVPATSGINSILKWKPNIFVKGTDYRNNQHLLAGIKKACRDVGAKLILTRSEKLSTSDTIKKIQRTENAKMSKSERLRRCPNCNPPMREYIKWTGSGPVPKLSKYRINLSGHRVRRRVFYR